MKKIITLIILLIGVSLSNDLTPEAEVRARRLLPPKGRGSKASTYGKRNRFPWFQTQSRPASGPGSRRARKPQNNQWLHDSNQQSNQLGLWHDSNQQSNPLRAFEQLILFNLIGSDI